MLSRVGFPRQKEGGKSYPSSIEHNDDRLLASAVDIHNGPLAAIPRMLGPKLLLGLEAALLLR